jgi:hypothetical protein
VTHLITTPHELSIETAKVTGARKNKLPILSEDFVHASLKGAGRADESKYLLEGSASAPAPAPSAAADDEDDDDGDRKRKKRTTKPVDDDDDADEADEEVKPKRGAKKAAAPKKTGAKRAAASAKKAAAAADDDDDEKEEVKPAPVVPKEEKPAMTKQASIAVEGPFIGRRPNSKAEVVFSFDTTGSMYPCLTQVRKKIQEATQRLFKEVPGIKIGVIAHGDYCDQNSTYVTKHLDLTNDLTKIVNFVENAGQTGGGDAPECYELVLRECQTMSWSAGANHSLVLIGDDLPHEANANPQKIDWRTELKTLASQDICVYAVQALNRSYATNFYFNCAKETGGIHISLDQFNAITDLLVAVCYRESTPEQLLTYEKEVIAQGRYSRSVRQMFDKLVGREATSSVEGDKDLKAVPGGRFQVLAVDDDCSIKDFVSDNGLNFKAGRGFYEFTKPETVQGYKEIILMDKKNGDMFEGDYARELLGLPKGANAKIKPAEYDFVVFVQSTSYNRKLVAGTRFLYEVEDWDRSM